MTRKEEIDSEIEARKKHSDKVYKGALKKVASLNKILKEENHFYLQMVLQVGDKRKKT